MGYTIRDSACLAIPEINCEQIAGFSVYPGEPGPADFLAIEANNITSAPEPPSKNMKRFSDSLFKLIISLSATVNRIFRNLLRTNLKPNLMFIYESVFFSNDRSSHRVIE